MLRLMLDLNLSLEDILNTLDDVFDIVVSDVGRIDEVLTDAMVDKIYYLAYHGEITWLD